MSQVATSLGEYFTGVSKVESFLYKWYFHLYVTVMNIVITYQVHHLSTGKKKENLHTVPKSTPIDTNKANAIKKYSMSKISKDFRFIQLNPNACKQQQANTWQGI